RRPCPLAKRLTASGRRTPARSLPPHVLLPMLTPLQEHSMLEVADIRLGQNRGRPLPAGYVQLGVAKEIAPTLRAFGLDPDPIIKAAGLDPHLFEDGANLVPHRALGRLCGLSVAHTQCRHFGLLVGRRATILSLGLVGRLMLHSETLG